MPVFSPPTVADVPRVLPETRGVAYRFARHCSLLLRGRTVRKSGATYVTTDVMDTTGLTEGVDFFLGGHTYTVTDAVSTALVAAGYATSASPGAVVRSITWGALAGGTWDDFVDNYGTWG